MSDRTYNDVFPQPPVGLTNLGEAAVRAMYRYSVLVDISHMTERTIEQTFKLVESSRKRRRRGTQTASAGRSITRLSRHTSGSGRPAGWDSCTT